jgi:DNA-binding response OmpR family regulator
VTERILLVEDDARLGEQVVNSLRDAGFDATWVRDGREALALSPEPFALLVLDLMLPGAHGLDVLKKLRRDSDVPVLVLSARNDTRDKVHALGLGADDYVTKPFWPEELLARIQARLRRPSIERADRIESGDVTIDVRASRPGGVRGDRPDPRGVRSARRPGPPHGRRPSEVVARRARPRSGP